MSGTSNRTAPRLVARVAHRDVWFPDGLSELVAHTDGRYLSVTLTGVSTAEGKVYVEEFACEERDACFALLRDWLRGIGMAGNAHGAHHIEAWADDVARRIIDALYRHV